MIHKVTFQGATWDIKEQVLETKRPDCQSGPHQLLTVVTYTADVDPHVCLRLHG